MSEKKFVYYRAKKKSSVVRGLATSYNQVAVGAESEITETAYKNLMSENANRKDSTGKIVTRKEDFERNWIIIAKIIKDEEGKILSEESLNGEAKGATADMPNDTNGIAPQAPIDKDIIDAIEDRETLKRIATSKEIEYYKTISTKKLKELILNN